MKKNHRGAGLSLGHGTSRAILCSIPVLLTMLHAHAQEATAPATPTEVSAATDATDSSSARTLSEVSVIGVGEVRQVHRVKEDDAKMNIPGSNPMAVLTKLPGVHFQTGDVMGREESGTRISMRGFDAHHLGFTLDGVTLGGVNSGNLNGLSITRAIIPENLKGTEIAEGVGALSTFSTSNLGGTLQFKGSDPDKEFGFRTSATFGSHDLRRQYFRVDTGEHNGLSAYLSGENFKTNAWKGNDLPDEQKSFNGKVNYNFGENQVSLFVARTVHKEDSLPYMSLDGLRRLGYNWSYYYPDWQRAQNAANGIYSGGVTSAGDANYLGTTTRFDTLVIANGTFTLPYNMGLTTAFYHQQTQGNGHAYYPYTYTNGAVTLAPNSLRSSFYNMERNGMQASLSHDTDNNHIEAGVWFEINKPRFSQYMFASTGPQSGFISTVGLTPADTVRDQQYKSVTRQFYVRDTYTMMDGRLKLDGGFKSMNVGQSATGLAGGYATGSLTAKDNFLPQFGASFKLDKTNEVFAGYSENMSAFPMATYSPLFVTQAALTAANNYANLEPETSKTIEAGWRQFNPMYEMSLAAYYTKFKNRQLAISNCSGQFQICNQSFANVGSVTSKGLEATFSLHPTGSRWQWDNSLSYNDSVYDSNYTSGGAVVAIAGKKVVDAAPWVFSSTYAYKPGPWDLRVQGNYFGSRYVTMTNDEKLNPYWVFNASAAYDLGKIGYMKNASVSLNVSNIFNKQYVSTINTDGLYATDRTQSLSILQLGAPRAFSVTLNAKF